LNSPSLADECLIYCQRYPENKEDHKELIIRLCYLAGENAGQEANHLQARHYFSQAYKLVPSNIQFASNLALSLSNSGDYDQSLAIYEQIIASLGYGDLGFSPLIWTEAVNLNDRKGNYHRTLELVEKCILEVPENFNKEALKFANEIRKKTGRFQREIIIQIIHGL